MLQAYETRVADGFVMSGNEALVVCSLPSHTAQFLQVVAWVTSESVEIFPRQDPSAAGRDPLYLPTPVCVTRLLYFSLVCRSKGSASCKRERGRYIPVLP